MKSVKLSKNDKERIVRKAIEATFEKRVSLVLKKENALAESIYGEIVGPYIGTMSKLPETFFHSTSQLGLRFAGDRYRRTVSLSQSKRIPASAEYGDFAEYPETHKFTKQFRTIQILEDGIKNDSGELRRSLSSLMAGINTTKQLQETWPEGAKYLPAQNDTTDNLPAVNVAGVRDMIEKFSK